MRFKLLCAAILGSAALVSLDSRASDGVVIDRETGRPLAGAIIVREWHGVRPGPVQTSMECYRLASTTSDAGGRFSLRSISFSFTPFLFDRTTYIQTAYKTGYHYVSSTNEARVLMEPNAPDRATRLAQVLDLRIHFDCPRDDTEVLVEPVLRPAYREAQALVRDKDEWIRVDALLRAIEARDMGWEAAERRSVAREAHWRDSIVKEEAKGTVR
jgi:hypothetical protein